MKPIKVYIAGKVSPDSSMGTSFWRDEFCKQLEEKSGFKIINLDPTTRKALPFDPQMVFGRDSFFIKNSDLVIVNLTDDISVGGSQEMLIAKYFKKPLLGIAKEGGKFVNNSFNDFGRIVDFVHPFVLGTCDAIVGSEDEAAEWIKKNFEKIEPKGMSCVDDSIKYYMKNYLDKDEFAKSVF
ncbi:MAG TPA: hypothetical protein HA230_01455 [Candidatus Aenigmarchaeota archaeon]|nr:hypothetical protein [Candidatus Aenigmarchaeota archaeon]